MSLLREIVEFVLSVALPVATLGAFYGREWIERTTGLAPDGGSGAAERGLGAVLCTAMVVVSTVGLFDLRRWPEATA